MKNFRWRGLIIATTGAILGAACPSAAQATVKILTPTDDNCGTFIAAMDTGEPKALVTTLGGWALGFLSGVAQGTGVDILRNATGEAVMNRLYADCQKQPSRAMSVVLEEMAKSLVANH